MTQLVTHASGPAAPLGELVGPHLREFCSIRGWPEPVLQTDDLPEVQSADRSPHWNKIALLRRELARADEGETLLWVDSDIVLRGPGDPTEDFHPRDFQALTLIHTPHGVEPNTGVWALRAGEEAEAFLHEIWERGPVEGANLNDQARVEAALGFSSLPYLTRPVRGSRWLERTCWIDPRWNQLVIFQPDLASARGAHFGGMPLDQKLAAIADLLVRDRLAGRELAPELGSMPTELYRARTAPVSDLYPHPDDAP